MEISKIIPHIEALVFAAEKPIPSMILVEMINNALGFLEDRVSMDQLSSALEGISQKYNSEFYPFEMVESGGGWQFLTKPMYHQTIAQLNGEKFMKRLSTAALETLSIIAYKQPVTKSEMEFIRGVNCDYAVQKLLEKELVSIVGRKEDSPGQPLLYATSKSFMDYFGINSPEDLPRLSDITSGEQVLPTTIGNVNLVDGDINPDYEDSMQLTIEGLDEATFDEADIEINENTLTEAVDEMVAITADASTEPFDSQVIDAVSANNSANGSELEEPTLLDDSIKHLPEGVKPIIETDQTLNDKEQV